MGAEGGMGNGTGDSEGGKCVCALFRPPMLVCTCRYRISRNAFVFLVSYVRQVETTKPHLGNKCELSTG